MAQQSGKGTLERLSQTGNNALQRTINPGDLGRGQQQGQGPRVAQGGQGSQGREAATRIGRVMAKPGELKDYVKYFQVAKKNAYSYLYGNGFDKVAERLQEQSDLPMTERIGVISDALMREIVANARESGIAMPKEIIPELNDTVVNAIMEIGVTTGVLGEMEEVEEQEVQMAAEMFALREFLKSPPSDMSVSPEEVNELMQGIKGGQFDDIGEGQAAQPPGQPPGRPPAQQTQQPSPQQGVLGGMRNASY